ncbi:hypothetical protein CI109_103786 [Kwoniella shandongensis]|uniref:Uncharacterized protein n=1 Tax=Kwoniella shandongensis TaxID=1734106 RepID=A0A5M6C742_9TREE|nr:uncharacterized protein CI109_000518 [Kwoniella shandongensis]KAA5530947.1 hypothetical protein CI109_000518 [Kwoniella shandongensis]
MSAEAGPGPSTMASSPIVPTTAKQLRIKKRVINLVNPADPEDFSAQSMSPTQSPNSSNQQRQEDESVDTPPTIRLNEGGPTFANTPAGDRVRGILRPSGTPGSGNGVRFFPKNKFRIITPNQSTVQALSPAPKPPPSPTSSSFFSQLLAVTIPSMSPRRTREPTPEEEEEEGPVHLNDSWEVPGQEGEVSLVASSVGSADRTMDSGARDDDSGTYEKEDSWNGQPEIHSSPLSLPSLHEGNTSKDASYQDLELPSTDWQLPEDVSNLLTTKFSPQDPSFSLMDGSSAMASPQRGQAVPKAPSPETEFWGANGHDDLSLASEQSGRLDDSNPTIRRQLSPLPSRSPVMTTIAQVASPTAPRPFSATSIFADMSAEQADLTWPLTRRATEDEVDSAFPSPTKDVSHTLGSTTPKPMTNTGDITEFYDCTAMILSPPDSSVVMRRSPIAKDLVLPTKALFEAQAAHTTALSAELEIYRSLANKLQGEVEERDDVLAKLNMRALEAEVLQTQMQDLRDELAVMKASRQTSLSPSPSPMPRVQERANSVDLPSDRTMAAQSEAKELEIRLAKALSDAAAMTTQLAEVQSAKEQQAAELVQVKATVRSMEEKERDVLVKAEGKLETAQTLRDELENAHRQLDEKEDDLHALQTELDHAHRRLDHLEEVEVQSQTLQNDLEETQQQLEDARRRLDEAHSEEDEVHALRAELESAHAQLDELEAQASSTHEVDSLREELDEANRQISELETHVDELKQVKAADEEELEQLMGEVEKLRNARRKEEDWRGKVGEMERKVEMEELRRKEVERRLSEERELKQNLEGELNQLRDQLRSAQDELFHSRSQRSSPAPAKEDPALRAEVARLRSESASKDLEILNLQRRKVELKEDREMLNIALDSKQQELELMKRKFAVKGIAGSTPLGTSRRASNIQQSVVTPSSDIATPLPGKGMQTRRRSSLAIQTPVPSMAKQNVVSTPLPGMRHGVQLHPSTKVVSRVMRRVEEEENRPPVESLRRKERMLA